MSDILREEKKYELSIVELFYIKGMLENVLKGDSYNGSKPYLVRSLYFDSISNIDYFEKEAGVNDRKKIRLRIYNSHADNAKLELKEKRGDMQRKQSLIVSKEDALALIDGRYEVLKAYESELAQYIYRKMTLELYIPRTVVEYDRIALGTSENSTRITFDMAVRANEGNFNIFSDKLETYPIIQPDRGILEVKYNRFLLGYVKDMLQSVEKLETSCSKYFMARRYGLGDD